MRRFIKYLLLSAAIGAVLAIGGLWLYSPRPPVPRVADVNAAHPPDRLLRLGPVGTGIDSWEHIGDLTITMKAARLWVKKSKTLGFDNNLLKRLAAKDFQLIISKGERRVIALGKAELEMPFSRELIAIQKPDVLYPPDLPQPASVTFDKHKRRLSIKYPDRVEVWELDQM